MIRVLLISVLLVTTLGGSAAAQSTLFDQADSLLSIYEEKNLFSGSVLLAREGEVFTDGYGLANRSWEIPNTADTRFQLASLTKPFTATLVLQLAERGNLSLNDPISAYLSDYPSGYAADVTIHELLNHTSGIPNYTDFAAWSDTTSRVDWQPQDFVQIIAERGLEFQPGTRFRYSNSNYYLLGMIIENVTGMSYSRVLQNQITRPGRLERTGYLFNRMVVPRMAEGYERLSNGYYEKAPYHSPSTSYAAGGIFSVVEDLYRWEQLYYNDRLLSEESRTSMMSAGRGNYGYGWVVGASYPDEVTQFLKNPFTFSSNSRPDRQPYQIQWHWGSNPGFNSLLLRVPGEQWTIIILENQQLAGDPEGTNIFDIAGQLFQLLHSESG